MRGGSGLHVYVRIKPEHGFSDVRRAALAFARVVEGRAPQDVTTTWWRSVRGNPEGTVSTPLLWSEVADVDPRDFTIATVPARFAAMGDLYAGIDDAVFDIAPLLEWADRDEAEGAEVPPDADESE